MEAALGGLDCLLTAELCQAAIQRCSRDIRKVGGLAATEPILQPGVGPTLWAMHSTGRQKGDQKAKCIIAARRDFQSKMTPNPSLLIAMNVLVLTNAGLPASRGGRVIALVSAEGGISHFVAY